MAEVRLEGVSKSFGARAHVGAPAVDAVSFTAPARRLVALLGPSGCGKSTVLRLIAGLDEPSAGTIRIAGADVTALPPARRGVAMVFQSYALFPHLTVAENILFGLKVRKVAAAERAKRLTDAAALLSLQDLLARKPAQLSGGQQQRVALARAIVAQSKVCLMDEPLSNLDAQLRGDMRREIRALQRRLGMTLIYVTHDQVEAMTMADQVVLMRAGRIEQDAAPDQIYAAPETIFAARFIGTPPMNVVAARAVASAQGGLPVQPPRQAIESLALGVRPEDVRIGDSGVPASVVGTEYLGADSLIETRIGEEAFMVRVPGRMAPAPGEIVHVTWDQPATHWFDLSSGRRIP